MLTLFPAAPIAVMGRASVLVGFIGGLGDVSTDDLPSSAASASGTCALNAEAGFVAGLASERACDEDLGSVAVEEELRDLL